MTDEEILFYADKNRNRRKLKHDPEENRKVAVGFRIYKAQYRMVELECERIGITFSEYVNALIEKELGGKRI